VVHGSEFYHGFSSSVLVLSHSDHRFNLLFRAVDSIGGDGMVEQEDLVEFMFPGNAKEEAAQGAAGKCQSSVSSLQC
jgi:hypothetical protein